MAKQQLTRAEIAGLLVEQCNLSAAEAVGPVRGRIQPDERNPLVHQPCVLPRGQVASTFHPTWEQPITRSELLGLDPGCNRPTRLLGNLELHRPSRLLLEDHH